MARMASPTTHPSSPRSSVTLCLGNIGGLFPVRGAERLWSVCQDTRGLLLQNNAECFRHGALL